MLPKILANDLGKMIIVTDDEYKTILPIGEYKLHPDFLDISLSTIVDIYSISNAFIIQTTTHLYILSDSKEIKIAFTGSVYRVLSNLIITKENDTYKLYDNYGNDIIFEIPLTQPHWFSGDSCIVKENSSYLFYHNPFSLKNKIPDEIQIKCQLSIPDKDDNSFTIQGLTKEYTYNLSMRNIINIYSITNNLFLLETNDSKFHFFDKNIIELSSNTNIIDLDQTHYYSLYATILIQQKYKNDDYTFSFNYNPSYINLITDGHILTVNNDKTAIINLIPIYPKNGIDNQSQLCLTIARYIQKIIYANQAIYKKNMAIKNILTITATNIIQDTNNDIYILNFIDNIIDQIGNRLIYNFQPYTEYKLDTVDKIFSLENYLFLETNSGEYNVITFPNINIQTSTNFLNWIYSTNKAQNNTILSKYFTIDDPEYICIKNICNISETDNKQFFDLLSSFANNNELTYREIDKTTTTLISANQPVDYVKILTATTVNNNIVIIVSIFFIFVCLLFN
jgi:hypothetical protein